MIDSPWIIVANVAAVMVTGQFAIKLEEDKFGRAFGQEYQSYLTRVRRWL